MHIESGTALILVAVVSCVVLLLNSSERSVPMIALVAAGLEALNAFNIVSLSSGKFRIDVILPTVLAITAGICWARVSTKSTVTAATLATSVGALQLLAALHVLG